MCVCHSERCTRSSVECRFCSQSCPLTTAGSWHSLPFFSRAFPTNPGAFPSLLPRGSSWACQIISCPPGLLQMQNLPLLGEFDPTIFSFLFLGLEFFLFCFPGFSPHFFGDAVGFYVFAPACSKLTPQGAVCRCNQHPHCSCPLPRKLVFIRRSCAILGWEQKYSLPRAWQG